MYVLHSLALCLWILGESVPQVVLGKREEVGVPHTPDVGGSPIACLIARDVQDADLSEDGTVSKSHEDGSAVISNDVEFSPLDNVHLFADVALPADVVAGGEDLKGLKI